MSAKLELIRPYEFTGNFSNFTPGDDYHDCRGGLAIRVFWLKKPTPVGPMGVVRRPDGDLIVVDYNAHRLWRIDQQGFLYTFAGDGVPGNTGDGD